MTAGHGKSATALDTATAVRSALGYAQLFLASVLVLLLVVGAVATAARSRYLRGLTRRDLLLLGVCLALALAVRLCATTFPANTHLESAQGYTVGGAHRWAAGLSAVLHFLFLFLPGTVATIAKLNVILSLATIVGVFILADSYLHDRFAGFSAAAVLALHPIAVRYANSDSSGILQTFCLVAGAAFLARWNGTRERWALLQGGGWLVLAANVRYESIVYVVAGALILLGAGWSPRRTAVRDVALLAVCAACMFLYPVGRALLDTSQGVFEMSPLGYLGVFVLSRHSPAALVGLAFVGLAVATWERFRAAVCFLLALVVVSLPGYFLDLESTDLSNRFALPQLALWAVFAGYGCSVGRRGLVHLVARARRTPAPTPVELGGRLTPVGAGAVLLLALAVAIPHRGFLARMWTHALEYQFIVSRLGGIPDACLMVGPDSGYQARGLRISRDLSREVGRSHRWLRADSAEVLAGKIAPCTVYYRATACHGFEGVLAPDNPDWSGAERPVCRNIGERYDLEPIATTTIPSRSYMGEAHTVDPVPVGFYQMRPKGVGRAPGHE